MTGWNLTGRAGWRRAAGWLLLAAVLLRAVIPAGLMPDLGRLADGGFPLVICADGFERTIWIDGEGQPIDRERPGHLDAPCLFAGLSAVVLPLLLALALLTLVPLPRRRALVPADAPLPDWPPGPVSARGPPLPSA